MKRSLLEGFLCCPVDRSFPLQVEQGEWEGEELNEGVLRCGQCGARYPVQAGIARLRPPSEVEQPEVAQAKERESKGRDADVDTYDSTVSDFQTRIETEALLEGLGVKPGEVVLDLGAGTGRLTEELVRRGATVVAVDISPASLQLNRERCARVPGAQVHHLVVDACYLPLRSGLVHKVCSGMMLEHLPTHEERQRCLEGVHRVLAPGGRLALTVYNYTLRQRLRGERSGMHRGDTLYYYNFDLWEMRGLLRDYRVHTLTALLNLSRFQSETLDKAVRNFPLLASLTGKLLLAVAERKAA